VSAARCLLNDRVVNIAGPPGALALAWLREREGLTGSKEGCGEGECGTCAVLLGERDAVHPGGSPSYRAVCACLLPLGELPGRHLVTIEGLNHPEGLGPVQRALVDAGAPQCGFCIPGIVVSLTGYFLTSRALSRADAVAALDGNVCRCSGYASILRALESLSAEFGPRLSADADRVEQLVDWGILPAHFASAARSRTSRSARSHRGDSGLGLQGRRVTCGSPS